MRTRLENITLKGFKTIRALDNFQPGPLTVLIGPNAAGKSNFLSFFQMLSAMVVGSDLFQYYVGLRGGASKILHDGPAITPEIDVQLRLHSGSSEIDYAFRLAFGADDTLIFAEERYRKSQDDQTGTASWHELGAGHRGPQLLKIETDDDTASVIFNALLSMFTFQFHNTSMTSPIRNKTEVHSTFPLSEHGDNVAPFLYNLKGQRNGSYRRIVDTLRLILPFFSDFVLEPDNNFLLLAWRETNSDQVFTASQAADGMLRTIALVTLLLQPDDTLPDLLVIDEPELGLHPYAINIIGGLIRAASQKTQVIVATQSPAFVDCFEPSDIVVVEREGRESTFRRLEDSEELSEWLEEYSLSELWEKNVIGGRP